MASLRRLLAAVASACTLMACAGIIDLEHVTFDGALAAHDADAVDASGPWGCLGHVAPQREDRTKPLDVVYTLFDLSKVPVPNISAKLCQYLDVGCQLPIGGPYVTDDDGKFVLPLYMGFRGYLDIAPSETHPELLPSLIYLPIVSEADKELHATLGSTLELNLLTGQAGKPADPARGHIVFVAYDCQLAEAANVNVYADNNTDEETYTFYFDANGSPSATQQKTSASGLGGVFNLKPGSVTLNFDYEGRRVSSRNLVVRQGAMTYVPVDPTP